MPKLVVILGLFLSVATSISGVIGGERPRVVVSTDIGGTDPDDYQSLVHLLVYADSFELEGLISSPYGPGRKQHILEVIDCYAQDFVHLRTYSTKYPTAESLRAITKQGETEPAPYAGVRRSTEGSQWIIQCARRDDARPLNVLVWGGIEDLAQALHDAPDILPKLRVYYIGGPNKKWGPDAYHYIASHHSRLWMIEANSTYRGWFTGGEQAGKFGNNEFVRRHVAGRGALGDLFVAKMATLKMGDSPSVGWLLGGSPQDPAQPSWGGQFVRAWDRPYRKFDRLTTPDDQIEVFGILELVLPFGDHALGKPEKIGKPERPETRLVVENQSLTGFMPGDGTVRFRFSPKSAKAFRLEFHSDNPALDGKIGGITAFPPDATMAQHPAPRFPHWWTDDPNPAWRESEHDGAKTTSRWRTEFLRDFAARMARCQGSN